MNFNDVYKKMALLESDASSCGCGSDCKCGGKCGGKCGDDNCPCECGKNTGVEETKKKEKTTESSKKNRGRQLYEEAQIDVSINGLSSTDAETLSQMLHLAGMAQQGGGGDMDPMGGDMDPMGNPVSAMTPGIDDSGMDMGPMNGDTLGTGDMAAFDQEGPMDMDGDDMGMDGDDDYHDHEDYEGGFDAEMGSGMEIEPADDMGAMSADDDAAVASTWDNEPDEMDASVPPSNTMPTMNAPEEELEDDFDVNDLLQLSGMKRLPENDEDKLYDNEPDEESSSDYSDLPTGGPNKKKSKSQGAPEAVKTIAVKERAERLKRKLAAAKG